MKHEAHGPQYRTGTYFRNSVSNELSCVQRVPETERLVIKHCHGSPIQRSLDLPPLLSVQ